MDDESIKAALTATGECLVCAGRGYLHNEDDVNDPHEYRCGACDRTGHDPLALLRAVQAVGLLLMRGRSSA